MGRFLEIGKERQARFKTTSPYFSEAASGDGIYRKEACPFSLPLEYAEENLFPGIRQSALAYFESQGIRWHDGKVGKPSNHLCDSQVCCMNLLFLFAD